MRKTTRRWLAALALPALLALAGCPPPNHDDDDDDTGPGGDDDSAVVDDDDDDDTTAGDDDDTTAGDDDNVDYYGVRPDDGSAPRHPNLLRDLQA